MRNGRWVSAAAGTALVLVLACSSADPPSRSPSGTGGSDGNRDAAGPAASGDGASGQRMTGAGGSATAGSNADSAGSNTTAGMAGSEPADAESRGGGGNGGASAEAAAAGAAGIGGGGAGNGGTGGGASAGASGSGGTANAAEAGVPVDAGNHADGGVDAAKVSPEPAVEAGPFDARSSVESGSSSDASSAADASAEASAPRTIRYGFDTSVQGWATSNASLTLATTAAHVDQGAAALAVTMNGASGSIFQVFSPPSGLTPGKFSFRIYIPSATTLSVIQPFLQTNAPDYHFTGQWWDSSNIALLARDTWQTVDVQVPMTYAGTGGEVTITDPVGRLGIQVTGTGTIYVDSVSW